MKYVILVSLVLNLCYQMANSQVPDSLPLYAGPIPNAIPNPDWEERFEQTDILKVEKVHQPNLRIYLPEREKATGTAVIICPGGGYTILAIDHEGYQIAEWFNSLGIAAFVLKYRLPHDSIMTDKTTGPLQDVQQAIRLVRKHANDWGINPAKIGVMGFSAGGHLASSALTLYRENAGGIKDNTSSKPDFGILIYPVITMLDEGGNSFSRSKLLGEKPSKALQKKFSAHVQVDQETSPTFLVATSDDGAVPPENSYMFYKALKDNGVPTELHIYQTGGHGYGFGKGMGPISSWPDRCKAWLESNGF